MNGLSIDFTRDGYVMVENVLARSELDRLLTFTKLLSSRTTRWPSRRSPRTEQLHAGSVEYQNVLARGPVLDLVDHPMILPLVVRLLGWNIHVSIASVVVTPLATAQGPIVYGWHRDSSRVNFDISGRKPMLSLKVAWWLTDLTKRDSGQMWVVPGSHATDSDDIDEIGMNGAVPLNATAGSVAIFDRRLWHSASLNCADHPRVAVFIAYTFRWISRHDEMYVPRSVFRHDRVRRQLLGPAENASSAYSPEDTEVPIKCLYD